MVSLKPNVNIYMNEYETGSRRSVIVEKWKSEREAATTHLEVATCNRLELHFAARTTGMSWSWWFWG